MVVLLAGCAAVPVATITAAAGAAASATQVSDAVFKAGTLRAAEMTTIPRLRVAVRHAIEELSYTLDREQEVSEEKFRFELHDEQNDRVVITIYRQTETLSTLRIYVGIFGHQQTARLIYHRIQVALSESDRRPLIEE